MFKLVSENRQRKSTVLQIIRKSIPSTLVHITELLAKPRDSAIGALRHPIDTKCANYSNFGLDCVGLLAAQCHPRSMVSVTTESA